MCCREPYAAKHLRDKESLGISRQAHGSFCIGFHGNNPHEQFHKAQIKAPV